MSDPVALTPFDRAAAELDTQLCLLGRLEHLGTGNTRSADRATLALRRLIDARDAEVQALRRAHEALVALVKQMEVPA